MKSFRYLLVLVFISLSASAIFAQQGFTNETRALLILDLSMIEQGNRLDEVFTDYRKEVEQIDDVVVIGVKA